MKLEEGLVGVELAMRVIWGQDKKDTVITTMVRYIIYFTKEFKDKMDTVVFNVNCYGR